jgi:hypothetical protein
MLLDVLLLVVYEEKKKEWLIVCLSQKDISGMLFEVF